ncbi:hypothetical protein [Calothrix sp. UHCC 0171]|uniref:hypothetical protein n=1 Tax=Calothrix sp. UHCC 0171 TaxID=3110245 RepID=UPI002B2022E4|nr:hypothetical protein [Calothrix sp. UHCC 0171]MEA5572718.1 hypothetical protein [Calothrix sp. UHCC 0171]
MLLSLKVNSQELTVLVNYERQTSGRKPQEQATGWQLHASGKIELIADKPSTQVQQPLTCAC